MVAFFLISYCKICLKCSTDKEIEEYTNIKFQDGKWNEFSAGAGPKRADYMKHLPNSQIRQMNNAPGHSTGFFKEVGRTRDLRCVGMKPNTT